MKNLYTKQLAFLLFVSLTILTLTSNAKNYYIAASGSDANTGLSAVAAWKTIAKVNASFSTFLAGDSILFKCGDTFNGSILANKSGSSVSPIVISSYGSGAKPVITGLTTLTGWTNVGGNIWQCTPTIALKSNVNIFTINGVPQAVGRSPWYVYQSATTTTLTSSTLSGMASYIGAEIVIKKNSYRGEKAKITDQSGSVITYVQTQGIDNGSVVGSMNGTANYGFFLQRFAGSLDQQGEWFYNATTQKMQLYSTTDPSAYAIKASYLDTIINLNNRTYITIQNLAIEGGGLYGIESSVGSNIAIKNCSFNNNTRSLFFWNTDDVTVDGNTINNSLSGAVMISNNQRKRIIVSNNTVTNTGQLIGMGLYWSDSDLKGIVARTDTTTASNYVNIIGNIVRNTGHAGIQFQGSNVTVRRNVIDTFANVLDDNGGIYTFTNNSSLNKLNYRNRLIDSNFILNGIGAPTGANNVTDVAAYYLDDQSANITGMHNTIANVPGNGVQMNTPNGNVFIDNTVYNCATRHDQGTALISIGKYPEAEVYNNIVKGNVIYQKDSGQLVFFHGNSNLTSPTTISIAQSLTNMASIDSNWTSNMKTLGYGCYYSASGTTYTFPPNMTLAQWKATYNHDVHSTLPPVAITATNTRLEYNPGNSPKTVFFQGLSKIDPKGVISNDSIVIPAWSSRVLIDKGASPVANKLPVANAGSDKVITLPVNSTSLAGAGTDTDGMIAGYAWTKISGPSSGTIATASAATTPVNSLTQGVYQYQLTVTDNSGGTAKDTVQVTVNAALNIAPVANAGSDITITLPGSSITLTGSGTDADGNVNSYAWVKISGPSSGTISAANAATTAVNSLTQGVYQYQLIVTDNSGATAKDTVQVTVNAAPNQRPIVTTGGNKLITLPVNSVSIAGSATDVDGTISSYAWVKVSGPSAGTIVNPSSATTAISNLAQGIYKFEITATDNSGGIAKDSVTVTVNAAPVVNAGSDKLISLPNNTVTLNGVATDADGTISSYSWAKISGPSATISTANAATTAVNNLVQGVYQFELTATDNNGAVSKDTVIVTVNAVPVVNAGLDKLISLPNNTVTLNGVATDADGTISSYAWAKISGPSSASIINANASGTIVNNLVQGVYQFSLTVTDNNGAISKDTVIVTVNAAPVVNAGSDKLISLPLNTVTLTGMATDADGTINSYSWAKISGPSAAISTANAATTAVNNLVQGVYQFELTATDNNGAVSKDTVIVTVNAAPVVNAGADKLISLPINTVTLNGIATDADGTISSYSWAKISGPSSSITTANASTTAVNNLVQGVYQFELTVADNNGAVSKDTVVVMVNAAPVVNAGSDKLISLPINTVTLNGVATDADGTISSYSWAKISGPSATMVTTNSATTTVNNLVQGVYQFELTATDNNGAISKDTVLVTVNAAPVVNAGADILISLPINTVTLNGIATDADGTISSYSWVKISGPSATIATANAVTTAVNNLVQGVYQFELTATDNNGAVSKDTVIVVVNAAPMVNAGADLLISLPINTVTLAGIATDSDGTISSYSWAKISGPSATIATVNASTTAVNNLIQGIYQFELTAIDNNGAVSKDTVLIIVNAAPAANAGVDKLISLPLNTISLNGNGLDTDGTVVGYSWVKISGPSFGTIINGTAATALLSDLVQGIYQYELTVTDNNGSTGKDTVIITVNAAPVVNAGNDNIITLPVNTVTLAGSATDIDGTIAGYSWAKISGPSAGTIATGNAFTTVLNDLAQGIYQYELTATDNNGSTGKDTVQITVNAAPNVAPTANAGTDNTITLPANTVTLSGSGTDTDGTISAFAWVKIYGPSAGTIATPAGASTVLNNLAQGVYQYELTVTDNNGAISKDTVQVIVNAAPNLAPIVNAGTDIVITWPGVNSISLSGSATDADGTITKYIWVKISGPSAGAISSVTSAATKVYNLTPGTYQYELTAKDNTGLTAKDTVQVFVNRLPVANAGTDTTIGLPVNTAVLNGSGTDADGTISTYLWTKIAGPATGKIETTNASTTVLSSLVQGTYKYTLTVTDNSGASAKDTVIVTVNAAPNKAPVANAGIDKIVTLPTGNITLTGKGTDADGTISVYAWIKVAGPSSGTISNAGAATTGLTGLAAGTYQYELTVTDNKGATAKDTVQVFVNTPPAANAGADTAIGLPVNTVVLNGSGIDADGTINTYVWTKIAGPATGKIETANASTTVLSSLVQGIYKYVLTVTDNNNAIAKDTVSVTVNAVPNQAPVSNAGVDKMITLPTSTAALTGKGTDSDGTISVYAWIKVSGPASGTIAKANAATTSLTGLTEGVYQYELTVTDNKGAIGKDTIQVTVNAALNLAPKANAGADYTIILPATSGTLTGNGTDADGTISTYAWVKISGPLSGAIAGDTTATASLTDLTDGIYQYELTVTDNSGAIAKDTVVVTVNAAPVANAGTDIVINWPGVNSINLSGSATDTDGTIAKYTWARISGPVAGTISSATSPATKVFSLAPGVYQYELTVKDNTGLTGKDTVQVFVNRPPVVNAGNDTVITLPANTSILTGIATDADGTVASYIWTKLSGSSAAKIETANASSTVISNLTQGTYKYVLTVVDNNGASAKDTIQVTINAASAARTMTTEKVKELGSPVAAVSNGLKVYPNPVSDVANLNITTDGNTKLHMSVTDMSGRMVKSGEITNTGKAQTFKLNMSDLQDGYYIISVTFADGQRLISKVLKYGGK